MEGWSQGGLGSRSVLGRCSYAGVRGSPQLTLSVRGPGGPSPGLRLTGSRAAPGQAENGLQGQSLDWNMASIEREPPPGSGPFQTLMMPRVVLWPSGSEVKLWSLLPIPTECSRQIPQA